MAICSSSIVLSFEGAVASSSPLFVGDVLIDAGAENSPLLLPPHPLFHLEFKFPENEYGCCRTSCFSFPPLKKRMGRNALAYLFSALPTSKLTFFFVSFLLPTSNTFRHFARPNKEKELEFLAPVFEPPALLSLVGFLWVSSMSSRIGRLRLSKEVVEALGEVVVWEKRRRGRRCPWKKISSAGERSMAMEGGWWALLVVLYIPLREVGVGGVVCDVGWKENVKEKSWDGEEDEEGGGEVFVVGLSWPDDDGPCF